MRKIRSICVALVAAGVLTGIGVAAFGQNGPPDPPWVDPVTGRVDVSKVPTRIPVSDANGKIAGYVDRSAIFGPPPGADVPEVRAPVFASETSRTVVGRFGPDGFVRQ